MTSDTTISINEIAINNIILDIDNYQKNIKQILNSISDTYKKLSKNTNYNGVQSYSAKANLVLENIKVMSINFENYKSDLNKIKASFKKTNVSIVENFDKESRNMNVGKEYIIK